MIYLHRTSSADALAPTPENEGSHGFSHSPMGVAAFILAWIATLEVIVGTGWFFNVGLLALAPVLAFGLLSASAFLRFNRYPGYRESPFPCIATSLAIILASVLLAALFHDFSDDGQAYHQEAVLALAEGWNPFRVHEYHGDYPLWVSHYAKAPWIFGASMMALTGNIESGKAINFLLMACTVLVSYEVLRKEAASRRAGLALAVLLVFNPISASQFWSYCVDAQLGCVVFLAAFLALRLLDKPSNAARIALAASIVFGMNIKFSAIPFLIVITSIMGLHAWMTGNRSGCATLAKSTFAGCLLALFVGFQPYITNTLDRGHPFFPLAGSQKVDIISGFVTAEFYTKNRFEKLALSLASESHNIFGRNMEDPSEQIRIKPPFLIRPGEIKTFYKITDTRIAGFGPLMSGALLMSLACCLALVRRTDRPVHRHSARLLMLGFALAVSIVIFPESWWARYVPQMWLLALLPLVPILAETTGTFRSHLARVTFAVFMGNTLLLLILSSAHQVVQELDYRAQIESLRQMSVASPIVVVEEGDRSTRFRMRQEGVSFVSKRGQACTSPDLIMGSKTSICLDRPDAALYKPGSPFIAGLLGRQLPRFANSR